MSDGRDWDRDDIVPPKKVLILDGSARTRMAAALALVGISGLGVPLVQVIESDPEMEIEVKPPVTTREKAMFALGKLAARGEDPHSKQQVTEYILRLEQELRDAKQNLEEATEHIIAANGDE